MFRIATGVVVMVAAAVGAASAAEEATKQSEAPRAWVVQPDKIPGSWKLEPQPLPPLEEIVGRPAAAMPVYGLYTWAGEYKDHRESMKRVGWKSYRFGGPFDDSAMKMVCEDGVEVMKTLGLRDVAGAGGNKKNRADYEADEPFIADYVAGIEAFLTRYGPEGTFFKDNPDLPKNPVKYVEIWNEPNFQYMIPDREPRAEVEREREALYAKVLPAAYKAIKARWPQVTVLGFGAGGASKGDIRFIKNVHEKGAEVAKSYDALSTHPYSPPVAPEAFFIKPWGGYATAASLKEIRDILGKHGRGDARIWYTEAGWPISKADGGFFETDAKKEHVTPLLQAAYVCRMYALAMRLGVERVHIMFATDTDNFNGGFFLRDKSWRPSAYAVQTMIKVMPRPKLVSAMSDGTDGFYAYRFQPRAEVQGPPEVVMAWNVGGPKKVELPWTEGDVAVMDIGGNKSNAVVKDGKLSLEVGPCPIYFHGKHSE